MNWMHERFMLFAIHLFWNLLFGEVIQSNVLIQIEYFDPVFIPYANYI